MKPTKKKTKRQHELQIIAAAIEYERWIAPCDYPRSCDHITCPIVRAVRAARKAGALK